MERGFPGIVKAVFVRRCNRFVVECEAGGHILQAHLPNPGRLWELLLPGRTLYLQEREAAADARLPTVMAVEKDGVPVLLHTQLTNRVAAALLAADRVPGLEGARIVRSEVPYGRSRFDFLLARDGRETILEVKSCTLFGRHTAMFPDAVTARGRRHLEELASLARPDRKCGVLFVVHTPRVRFFLPDYHTDLDFARTFHALRERLFYRAVAVSWGPDLTLGGGSSSLAVPWRHLGEVMEDRGSYLLCLHLPQPRAIDVGALGQVAFPAGYYVYVGTAAANLRRRLERHLRLRKRLHWHIDYLRARAPVCFAAPIRTADRIEHDLAASVAAICDWTVPRFGSSDCGCPSHLFGFTGNPLREPRFVALLQHYRMDRLALSADDEDAAGRGEAHDRSRR